MARIEIEEAQPASIVATHTLLRSVLGVVVLLEVADRVLHYDAWQRLIAQLAIASPSFDAPWLARALLVMGAVLGSCLLFGLLTRLCALCVMAGVLGTALATPWMQRLGAGAAFDSRFELACLLFASATYLVASGAGTASLDTILRRRARRRAIERDPIWNSAPYSVPPDPSRNR